MTQQELLTLKLGDEIAYCKGRWVVVDFIQLGKDGWPIIQDTNGKMFTEALYVSHLIIKLEKVL